MENRNRTPWWMTILILVAMSPVLMFPFLITNAPADGMNRMLEWFYPAYVLATGICAWITYPQRPVVTWILLILLLLSHAAMYLLMTNPVM